MTIATIEMLCKDRCVKSGRPGLSLPGGVWVSRKTMIEVFQCVTAGLSGLVPGVRYTAEELYGADRWQSLTVQRRRLLGRCLRWLARRQLMPVVVARRLDGNPYRGGKHKYQLDQRA